MNDRKQESGCATGRWIGSEYPIIYAFGMKNAIEETACGERQIEIKLQ